MAFSKNLTKAQIIEHAIKNANMVSIGNASQAEDDNDVEIMLDSLVRQVSIIGFHPWTDTDVIKELYLTNAVYEYGAGSTVINNSISYVCIQTHASGNSGVTEPGVGSGWEAYWDITDVITATAWTDTNFTGGIDRDILRIKTAIYLDATAIPVRKKLIEASLNRFESEGNLEIAGIPKFVYLTDNKSLGSKKLKVDKVPGSVTTERIRYTYTKPIADFASLSATGDFPEGWVGYFVQKLTAILAMSRQSVPADKAREINALADNTLQQLSFGIAQDSVKRQISGA